jgi:hypothetical protein
MAGSLIRILIQASLGKKDLISKITRAERAAQEVQCLPRSTKPHIQTPAPPKTKTKDLMYDSAKTAPWDIHSFRHTHKKTL